MTSPRLGLRRAALAAAALLAAIPSSAAALGNTPVASGYTVDGTVYATATDAAGRLYIGGEFSSLGTTTGSSTQVSATTGDPVAGFPKTDGQINAVEPDGAGGWYVAGAFTTVGGVKLTSAAHVLADGSVDKNWAPNPNGTVQALAKVGDHVYFGGSFSNVGGKPRSRLARVSAGGTGAVDAKYFPEVSATTVNVLELRGSQLYVGGQNLSEIGGSACAGVCRMTTATTNGVGAVDLTWQPPAGLTNVKALAFTADSVYVGGLFPTVGATVRPNLAKLALSNAALDATWDAQLDPGPPFEVRTLAVVGSRLYVGGFFPTIGGQPIPNLARVSTTGTGAVDTTWTPDSVGGTVNDLAVSGDALYAVGEFFTVGVADRYRAAKFSIAAGSDAVLSSWAPRFNWDANEIAITSGGNLLVAGSFTSFGTAFVERLYVARFDASGKLDPTWKPRLYGPVYSLATSASSVYIGGWQPDTPTNLVKVSQTGAGARDTNWVPTAAPVPAIAWPMALATDGTNVFIGFGMPGNGADNFTGDALAKVSATGTGTEDTAWNPNITGAVRALLLSGTDLFVGGEFQSNTIGTANRSYVAKLSTTGTGAAHTTWDPVPNNNVRAFAKSGDDLYLAGDFTTLGSSPVRRLAKVSASGTGAPNTTWTPNPNNTVRAITVSGGQVYAGGDFSTAAGETVTRLGRFSASGAGEIDLSFQAPAAQSVRTLSASPTRIAVGGSFPTLGGISTGGFGLIDLVAPTLTLNLPAEAPALTVRQGAAAAVSFSCDDDGGVVVSCAGTQPNGAALDTSTVGTHAFTVTATDESGNTATKSSSYVVEAIPPTPVDPGPPAPTPAPAPKDLSAPLISKSALTPKSFKAAGKGASIVIPKPTKSGKLPKLTAGTRIALTLSEAATVKGTVLVPAKGKTKAKTVGSFTQAAATGSSSFDFTGRIAGKKLKPCKYTLELVATDAAGNASTVASLSFTIKR